jgi:U3 small nucleolar RNA-associated protein 21
VWDILTGSLVDWVQFKRAPISLDFAPSGEYLATSHVGSKAVYLWSNRGHFQSIIIQSVPKAPSMIELPSLSQSEETVKQSHKDFYNVDHEMNEEDKSNNQSLIQAKFNELQDNIDRVGKQREDYLRISN